MYMYVQYSFYKSCTCTCSYETEVFQKWVEGVDSVAKTNLEKPLLVWDGSDSTELLKVNFDVKVLYMYMYYIVHVLIFFTLNSSLLY